MEEGKQRNMERIEKILDRSTDIIIICFGIAAIIFVTIWTINGSEDYKEQECVKFYKENNYITKSCEIYKEKLEENK